MQLVTWLATAIRSAVYGIADGALLAAEVSTVNIQIPGTIGAVRLTIEGIGTKLFRRTTGDIIRMRAKGTLRTTISKRRDRLAAINL